MAKCLTLFLTTTLFCAPMMNKFCYEASHVGDTIDSVYDRCGPPYTIHSHGGNTDVYEYIEWVYMGTRVVQTRYYYLVVTHSRIVGKHMRITNPPPLYEFFNSDNF